MSEVQLSSGELSAQGSSSGQPPPLGGRLPALLDWGGALTPLATLGLLTVAAPWLLAPIGAASGLYALSLLQPVRRRARALGPKTRSQRVAIVGAGPSGVVALKEFCAAGHDARCFEAGPAIGGVFASCPERTRLTTSAALTAFSDFPPPPDFHNHWTTREYQDYLERYVEHFGLRGRIELGSTIAKAQFDEARGGWMLEVRTAAGMRECGPFDTLAVCSGLNQKPNIPAYERNGFGGEILHSKHYGEAAAYAGKRVLVVGLGETGADIIPELAEVAASCVLSLRRGAFVIPRLKRNGRFPVDYNTNRLRYALPKWAHSSSMLLRQRTELRWGTPPAKVRVRAALGRLPRTAPPLYQSATKSDDFVAAIHSGRCRVAPGFVGFTPAGVVLEGGEEVEVDAVIFATGYQAAGFDFVGEAAPSCPSKLWNRMYTSTARERLVFIGFARPPVGALPPIAELQARYAAQVASGASELPPAERMEGEVAEHERIHERSFEPTRLRALVEWIPYMDELAERIGCRPRLRRLIRDPRLLWQIATGPMVAAQFRLDGPDADPELALQSIALPDGMPLREKLWYCALHSLVLGGALWEALPGRRRLRSCSLV